jgi:drug/metabolite transporter (DMT)-like permease
MILQNSAMARSASLAGIGMMLTGIFFFSLNDAMGKFLIATFSVGQILLIRSAAGLVMLSPFIQRAGWAAFRSSPRPGIQVLRAVFLTFEVAAFYWALADMSLADVMTFYLAGPVYVPALSPVRLGEQVGWRRWAAVGVGFIGGLIALDPTGASLTPAAFVAIAGSFAFAFSMICTRQLRGTPDIVLITWQTLGALVFGAFAAPVAWVALTWGDGALLILLGVVATFAHFCINRALKLAPASVVVPYQYTTIVWAIILGFIFFGDIPSWNTLLGATIIVAAGIYIFFREQVRATPSSFNEPP